jgi:hypothetical protein
MAELKKTGWVADIHCGTAGCDNYRKTVNLVSGISSGMVDAFCEDFGQGGDEADHCGLCGQLGFLADSYPASEMDSTIYAQGEINGCKYTVIQNRFKDPSDFIDPAQDSYWEVMTSDGECVNQFGSAAPPTPESISLDVKRYLGRLALTA